MIKEKTAIILRGGGMRSAHGAGYLFALATTLGISAPDIIIGSSGDAANALYSAAGQYESMKRIWCDLLSTPKFISFARPWKVMDVDYLIDVILKQQDPLQIEALIQSGIQWQIPLTNYQTGATRYIGPSDGLDPYEVLRAAKSIPILFGKRISLQQRNYVDGELGPTIEDHINHALELGAKRILLLNHESPWTWSSKMLMRIYSTTSTAPMRHAILRDITEGSTCLSLPEGKIICVVPRNLPCGTTTRDQQKIRETFERGIKDALAMKDELNALFSEHASHRAQAGAARLRDPQGV